MQEAVVGLEVGARLAQPRHRLRPGPKDEHVVLRAWRCGGQCGGQAGRQAVWRMCVREHVGHGRTVVASRRPPKHPCQPRQLQANWPSSTTPRHAMPAPHPAHHSRTSPISSAISMLAPSMVPMMSAPFIANFMLPVPLASVPAVEMCWLQAWGQAGGRGRHCVAAAAGGGGGGGAAPAGHPPAVQQVLPATQQPQAPDRAQPASPPVRTQSSPAHLSSVPGMIVSATLTL